MKRLATHAFVIFLVSIGVCDLVEAQTVKKVKMTIPVIAHSMLPVFLAQNRNYFADEKLEVEVNSTNGGGPDIRALIAGDVDFSFTTGDNVILAHQEGKRLTMVMSGLNKLFNSVWIDITDRSAECGHDRVFAML